MRQQCLHRYVPPAVVACLGLLLTLVLCMLWQRYYYHARVQDEFERRASMLAEVLHSKLMHLLEALESVGNLYAASTQVERGEFERFILRTVQQHAAIQGLDWVPRVPDELRAAFEMSAQAEGFTTYQFTERTPDGQFIRAGQREEYFPIYFVAPLVGKQGALGYDLGSHPARRAVLEHARDTGQMAATPPITLLQGTGQDIGVLVFWPIYANGVPTDTLAARRTHLQGFGLLVVRMDEAIREALRGWGRAGLAISVADDAVPPEHGRLYNESPPPPADTLRWVRLLPIADRHWRLEFSFLPASAPWVPRALPALGIIVLTGLTLTVSLSGYLFATANRRLRLEQAAQALGESEAKLGAVIASAMDAMITIDQEQRITLFNAAAERMFRCTTAEVLGQPMDQFLPERCRAAYREHIRHFGTTNATTRAMGTLGTLSGVRMGGEEFPIEASISQVAIAGQQFYTAILRDMTERQQAEQMLRDQATLAVLETDIGRAMARSESLADMLGQCTEAIVQHLDAAFARVWTLNDAENVLELQASAGMYTHINGAHARVPVGQFKIGLIAQERQPHLTNAVTTDPRVGDKAWACREGMVSFAGYPLMVGERLVGVIAMFARHALSHFVLQALGTIANNIALGLERLHARQALRESELRFRQLAEHIHEVFYLYETESARMLYVSPAYERIWGSSAPALYQQATDFIEAVHPEDRPGVYAMLDQHRRGEDSTVEYRIMQPNGEVRWILDRAFPFRDSTQGGYRVAGVAEDVTERKQAEEQRRRLALTLENAWDAVIGLDLEARITSWSPGAARLYGYEAHEVLGHVAPDLLMPDAMPDEYAYVLQRVRHDTQMLYESKRRTKVGEILDVEISCLPIRHEDGTMVGQLSITRDITKRKQAEEALRQMNDILEQRVAERTAALSAANTELAKATRLKDEFLASMSHELRTPLNAILGLSEALQEQVYGPLTDKQSRSLYRIEESGHHLLALITDILDLSKIEAGKVELHVTPVDVEGVCQASLRLIRESAHKKHLIITSTVDHAVPTLVADERRLKQMLVNLLSNAVKFTPAEGSIGLEVTGNADEQLVSFTVWDTGIGIAEADRERLFQPFVQLDSSLARHHAGTGLGLSLVARLAELHGGHVTLESTMGQGSRFSLVLPWRVATQDSVPERREEEPGSLLLAGLECVMVVEDTPAHAEQVVRYLHELAVNVMVYPQGEGAVDYALAIQPDVILLDLALPQGSGWEVLAQLKTEPRTRAIPVVIVSVIDEQAQGLAQGAAAYLVKPLAREQLQTTMRQVIASQQLAPPLGGVMPQNVASDAGPLLLLADDNEMNVTTVSEYLHAKGYRVAVAGTGAEALAQARVLHPALILMDIQMPGMDGLEATRRLRTETDTRLAATPIIALTALAMPGDRERCLAAGANAYVTKPVSLHDLLQAIETQLQG